MPDSEVATQRLESPGSAARSISAIGATRGSNVLPSSRESRICACPYSGATSTSPERESAWKSEVPSSDTDSHVLPASEERIRPSAGGSVESPLGCPEATSSSGPVKRATSDSDTAPSPLGVFSCPVTLAGLPPALGISNSPVFVPMKIEPDPGLTLSEPMYGGSPSGSTHGTASAAWASPEPSSSPPQPATSAAQASRARMSFRGMSVSCSSEAKGPRAPDRRPRPESAETRSRPTEPARPPGSAGWSSDHRLAPLVTFASGPLSSNASKPRFSVGPRPLRPPLA